MYILISLVVNFINFSVSLGLKNVYNKMLYFFPGKWSVFL